MATIPYRPIEAIQLLRPYLRLSYPHTHHLANRHLSTSRPAKATHSSTQPSSPPRNKVTVLNDTGRTRWTDLSTTEKAARTTQQTFNLAIVLAGVLATGAVGILLFTDVFSPTSKTAHFNRATTRVRSDKKCQELLGEGSKISAHGEASWSRWARNRFIASSNETDKWGTEHMRFRFYVEGPRGRGVVHVHLQRRPSQSEFEYVMLAVDVEGKQRVYLENADEKKGGKVAPKFFGARWW